MTAEMNRLQELQLTHPEVDTFVKEWGALRNEERRAWTRLVKAVIGARDTEGSQSRYSEAERSAHVDYLAREVIESYQALRDLGVDVNSLLEVMSMPAPTVAPLAPAPVAKATFSLTTEVIERLEKKYGSKGRSAAVDNILRGSFGMPPRPPVAVGSRFKAKT